MHCIKLVIHWYVNESTLILIWHGQIHCFTVNIRLFNLYKTSCYMW